MKYNILIVCFIFSFFVFFSCKKEPSKGDYRGTFTGNFAVDSTYSTVYYFEVTRSTQKEMWLKEKQSQTISKLKKNANNSISGMIGFVGEIYDPEGKEKVRFNGIKIDGTYNSDIITGTFSIMLSKDNQDYKSTGTFILEPF